MASGVSGAQVSVRPQVGVATYNVSAPKVTRDSSVTKSTV